MSGLATESEHRDTFSGRTPWKKEHGAMTICTNNCEQITKDRLGVINRSSLLALKWSNLCRFYDLSSFILTTTKQYISFPSNTYLVVLIFEDLKTNIYQSSFSFINVKEANQLKSQNPKNRAFHLSINKKNL